MCTRSTRTHAHTRAGIHNVFVIPIYPVVVVVVRPCCCCHKVALLSPPARRVTGCTVAEWLLVELAVGCRGNGCNRVITS